LISHRISIDEAAKAYEVVAGSEPSLGILLSYPGIELTEAGRTVTLRWAGEVSPKPGVGLESASRVSFIGAGNYATAVLIPAFKAAGAQLHSVASSGGVSGVYAGRKFGFAETTTDSDLLFADEATDAVVITTRHNSHARFVLQAIAAGKHVFCEKPLCLTLDELVHIEKALAESEPEQRPMVMVGFNRRFAPQVVKINQLLQGVIAPKAFVMTVNAGAIPADHWTQDPAVGGGRIVGEGCHFIDLLRFLANSPIVGWDRSAMKAATQDTVTIHLNFADGSIGTIHYFANGTKAFPKERLEVFAEGRVLQLDNYRRLTGFGWPGFKKMNLWRQDKGQKACAAAFIESLRQGGRAPIPFEELLEVSRVTIELVHG
jgi:predicted dehydrogenase